MQEIPNSNTTWCSSPTVSKLNQYYSNYTSVGNSLTI